MRKKTFLVWILIFVAFLFLLGIIFWKTSLTRKASYYELWGNFGNIGGLKTGDEVRFRGKIVGFVGELAVEPAFVKVGLMIDQNIQIPDGSVLRVGSEGIITTRFLEILPASDRLSDSMIAPGSVLPTEEPISWTDLQYAALRILAKIDRLADSLNRRIVAFDPKMIRSILSEAQEAVHGFKNIENSVVTTMDSLEALSHRIGNVANALEDLAADSTLKTDLKTTVSNLRHISTALKKLCFWSR